MKHLFLLIIVVLIGYVVWQVTEPAARSKGLSFLVKHGLKLGGLILVLLGLVGLAHYLPSTSLL